MTILIGGKGFLGSRLNTEIAGCRVLDLKGEGVEYCDIRNPSTLAMNERTSDKVVLLAAEHRDDVSPSSKYYETNVQGTKNVLAEMDRVGCKHLIDQHPW